MGCRFDDVRIAFQYRSDKELQLAKKIFSVIDSPFITGMGIAFTKIALRLRLPVITLFRKTLFKQFCGGISLEEAGRTAEKLRLYNVQAILDYGVEAKDKDSDWAKTFLNLKKAVKYAADNRIPFISIKITGIARFSLLEKLHKEGKPDSAEEKEWELVINRMDAVCSLAAERGVKVLIDAEETWIQYPVNMICDQMMQQYNKKTAVVFNTFQLYCKGTLAFLKESHRIAKAGGYILGAKLVRGAYMEKERLRADKYHYPSPIQENKATTDQDFDAAIAYCLEHINEISLFIGTHNEKSCYHAISLMNEMDIPAGHAHIFFSQLYGMSDPISFNLADNGYQVAKYLPYGPVKDVIPYLLRRAEENTSIAGQSNRELSLIKAEIKRRKQMVSLF